MRIPIALVLAAAFLTPGCAARQAAPPSRDNPTGTVEMFKLYRRQGNRAGEWDILSPSFKQRLSQRAGRPLDVADYEFANNSMRGDSQYRLAEQMLQTAIVRQTQPIGENRVRALVQTSGGPLAKSAWIEMVRLDKWELYRVGQDEPFHGFVGDPEFSARRNPDGSFSVGPADFQTTIPAEEVRDYRVTSAWYVDSLGELENQFFVQ